MSREVAQSLEEQITEAYRLWRYHRLTPALVERLKVGGTRYTHPTKRLTDLEIFTAGYLAASACTKPSEAPLNTTSESSIA